MKKETIIETTFLIIFIGILLWIGLADSWDHKIKHDYPYSYLASDTFQHQTRAQWIKDTGNYKYEAPYYSAGFNNVIGFYPPILLHIAVLFSHISGTEVYDTILLITIIFAITGCIIFYNILSAWNKQIAILSTPLMTYIFTIREARNAFYWGHWPALLGDLFLVACCWMLINLRNKKSSIILGLLLAGTALGHTSATIFTVLFIIFFFAIATLRKQFTKEQLKKLFISLATFIIISAYVLIIFKQTWMKVFPFEFKIWTDWTGGGGIITLPEFGTPTLLIMLAGLFFLILSKSQESFFPKMMAIFALGAGFTNYVGFYVRAFNFRFYWPILLSALFGTGAYKILKIGIKNLTTLKSAIISLLIITTLLYYNYQPTGPVEGLMNKYTWQTLNWLKDNTEENAQIFFFYGDTYDQDGSLGNTHRINTRVEINDLAETLQKRKLTREYPTKELIESGTQLPYKKSIFSYGRIIAENKNITGRKIRDLCSFDYYIFDRFGRIPVLTQLNQIVANTLLQNNFTIIFENQLNAVLKNTRPGGNCLGTNNTINF